MTNEKRWDFRESICFSNVLGIQLELCREKDKRTLKEKIRVRILKAKRNSKKYDEYGQSEIDNLNMESDLYNLRQYGIILQRNDTQLIKREIESHYDNIKVVNVGNSVFSEDEYKDILEIITLYIISNGQDISLEKIPNVGKDIELYCIPAKRFGNIFVGTDFAKIDLLKLREQLANDGYTKYNNRHTDYLIRLNKSNNPERSIAFYKTKIDDNYIEIQNGLDGIVTSVTHVT